MVDRRAPEVNVGGRLFMALIVAFVLGLAWACLETGRKPTDLLKLLPSSESDSSRATAPPSDTEPVVAKEVPALQAPPKSHLPKPEPPPKKEIPPAAPKVYSAPEMSGLFNAFDDLIRRGRFFEAREKISSTNKFMIPADDATKFRGYDERINRYYSLMLETTKGATIDMPPLTQIYLKSGGKLVVKTLREDKDSIAYETITGIRSNARTPDIESTRKLSPALSAAEVTLEHKKQADYRGLIVESEPGMPIVYKDKPGKTVPGLTIFDLADFCARNGANDKLAALFDEALKRDAELLVTVHEVKADRMVNVFLYFLSIDSAADANLTYEILRARYGDTQAFRDHVANDADVKIAMERFVQKPSEPIARAPGKTAAPTDPSPHPVEPKPPTPPVTNDPKPVEPTPAPPRPADPTLPGLPDGAPAKAVDLIARGDRFFEDAMVHLRNSDPNSNPDGWAAENRKALEIFMKATECYLPAQELFPNGGVPKSVLDRVRETLMRTSLCRKRSVSIRK